MLSASDKAQILRTVLNTRPELTTILRVLNRLPVFGLSGASQISRKYARICMEKIAYLHC
jgi:hypothetical protein